MASLWYFHLWFSRDRFHRSFKIRFFKVGLQQTWAIVSVATSPNLRNDKNGGRHAAPLAAVNGKVSFGLIQNYATVDSDAVCIDIFCSQWKSCQQVVGNWFAGTVPFAVRNLVFENSKGIKKKRKTGRKMASNVRDSDTSLWLHNKLGISTDSWAGGSICSQLNPEVLKNIQECFVELQTQVKLKFLLSFFQFSRRNLEEVSGLHIVWFRLFLHLVCHFTLVDSEK